MCLWKLNIDIISNIIYNRLTKEKDVKILSNNDTILVGKFNKKFNTILNINIKPKEIYRSKGLPAHMLKRSHFDSLKYIDYIPDIIINPDYIGVNPNEKSGETIELVKRYSDNILIGIKLDKKNDYLYVSTMHSINESKIQNRLHSGRLKEFK